MNALQEVITSIHSYAFSEMTLLEQVELLDKAQLEYDTLRAELEQVKGDRDELFAVTVKAFDAMFEIGVGLAPEELTPRVRALDHALANDLNNELWERINIAALGKDGGA